MRAITVCVDYADLLEITLPYNRHHFEEVYVVTSYSDDQTQQVALAYDCPLILTDLFYRDGAIFNKWRALEYGFNCMGRRGWICNMDADVLWPKDIVFTDGNSLPAVRERMRKSNTGETLYYTDLVPGNLYSPLRYMYEPLSLPLPPESDWSKYPIHRNVNEWAGYTQIFHASDPSLGPDPWHQIDWKHAGGADSFFQEKWPRDKKIRTNWNVLHLGTAGQNWYGRATPYLDGKVPEDNVQKLGLIDDIWNGRRARRLSGVDPFSPEKIEVK